MPSDPSAQLPRVDEPAKRRPPLRYSLLSVLELVAIVAIGLAFWRSWGSLAVFVNLLVLAVVLGFIVGRRLGTSRAKQVAIGIIVFWATLAVGVVVMIAVFLSTFTWFDYRYEHKGLTYRQFASTFDDPQFDPKGASHIYCYVDGYIDGYDEFWKMTIPAESYEPLLEEVSKGIEEPNNAPYRSEALGPVRKTTATQPGIPPDWRAASSPPPAWWQPQRAGPNTECTRWELQVRKKDRRAKGWYWVYDRDSQTLWIWEWNHQWQDLGCESPKES